MSRKWERQLEALDQTLARLEQEREQIQDQSEALAIHAAAIYLAGRGLTDDGLRFDPELSHDDEILDATIDLLVKQRMASIETEEIDKGHFVYTLEPDWAAILQRLRAAVGRTRTGTLSRIIHGVRTTDFLVRRQFRRTRKSVVQCVLGNIATIPFH